MASLRDATRLRRIEQFGHSLAVERREEARARSTVFWVGAAWTVACLVFVAAKAAGMQERRYPLLFRAWRRLPPTFSPEITLSHAVIASDFPALQAASNLVGGPPLSQKGGRFLLLAVQLLVERGVRLLPVHWRGGGEALEKRVMDAVCLHVQGGDRASLFRRRKASLSAGWRRTAEWNPWYGVVDGTASSGCLRELMIADGCGAAAPHLSLAVLAREGLVGVARLDTSVEESSSDMLHRYFGGRVVLDSCDAGAEVGAVAGGLGGGIAAFTIADAGPVVEATGGSGVAVLALLALGTGIGAGVGAALGERKGREGCEP